MMDPTIARLSYLNDAAHIMTLSAPSIAAAFQARYNHVADDNDIDPPATRAHEVCSACGHNMLSTASFTTSSRDKRARKLQKRARKDETKGNPCTQDKMIVVECRACLSTRDLQLPATKRVKASTGRTSQTDSVSSSALDAMPTPSRAASTPGPTTQISRAKAKRAKSRTSLHAMLAKSKEQAQSEKGFGFGLMDLMKST